MADNKKYFLDLGGLQSLWTKMKNTFASKTEVENNLETILNMVLAVSPKEVNSYSEAISAAPSVAPGIAIKVKNEETVNDVIKPAGIYLVESIDPVSLIYVGNSNSNISTEELANIINNIAKLESEVVKYVTITDGTNTLGSYEVKDNTLVIVHDDEFVANSNSINALTHRAIAAKFGELESLLTSIPKFEIKIVDELPTSDISFSTVYLLKSNNPTDNNLYVEYIYIHDNDGNYWEKLGEQTIILSDYVTKNELESLVNDYMKNYVTKDEIQTVKNEILNTVSENYATKSEILSETDIITSITAGVIGDDIKITEEQIEQLV